MGKAGIFACKSGFSYELLCVLLVLEYNELTTKCQVYFTKCRLQKGGLVFLRDSVHNKKSALQTKDVAQRNAEKT